MTETQIATPVEPPHLTSVDRVGKIPVVNDTLAVVASILSQNAYSKCLYSTAQAYSERAYSLSQPVQIRLAPVIGRVDGYANKGLDALESRWPYPFHITTEEVIDTLRQGPDTAYGLAATYASAATKAYEDRVKTPAYVLVSKVDSTLLTPIVDRFETVVNKLHKDAPSSPSSSSSSSSESEGGSERQYARAYRLSLDLKDQIIIVSSEQFKQLQQNNAYIQRATESLYNLTNSITNLSHESSSRAHHLAQSVLAELEHIQTMVQSRKEALPGQYTALKEAVGTTLSEVRGIVHEEDVPVGEKAMKVRDVVVSHVEPILQQVIEEGKKLVGRTKVKGDESKETPELKENGVTKGDSAINGSA
ncbi:TRAPP domain protein [Rhizoctonia solani 123E]|uniref:TRAPP domain protein n=1 Tax=Rhizoctonia solani 123E TaxID=1423351 RepID=A0A074SDJ1_9AGAM|nr:TRAPP domain protein [Rhizoctonia solani 123E]